MKPIKHYIVTREIVQRTYAVMLDPECARSQAHSLEQEDLPEPENIEFQGEEINHVYGS
jgi:hypothetical protein